MARRLPLNNLSRLLKSNGVPQVSQLVDCTTLDFIRVSVHVEVAAGVTIGRAGLEHVPNGVVNCNNCFDRSSERGQVTALGRVVRVVRSRSCHGCNAEGALQIRIARRVRVDFTRSADSLESGQIPAHEAR